MPEPRGVFEYPDRYWEFLTAPDDALLEDDRFDRKEACRPDSSGRVTVSQLSALREDLVATVSAFTNDSLTGGLIILGISRSGEVKGTRHLADDQKNSITNFDPLLVNHAIQVKFLDCD